MMEIWMEKERIEKLWIPIPQYPMGTRMEIWMEKERIEKLWVMRMLGILSLRIMRYSCVAVVVKPMPL